MMSNIHKMFRPNTQHSRVMTFKFKMKYIKLKRRIKNLIFENAALCDEVAQSQADLAMAREERNFLVKKLMRHEQLEPIELEPVMVTKTEQEIRPQLQVQQMQLHQHQHQHQQPSQHQHQQHHQNHQNQQNQQPNQHQPLQHSQHQHQPLQHQQHQHQPLQHHQPQLLQLKQNQNQNQHPQLQQHQNQQHQNQQHQNQQFQNQQHQNQQHQNQQPQQHQNQQHQNQQPQQNQNQHPQLQQHQNQQHQNQQHQNQQPQQHQNQQHQNQQLQQHQHQHQQIQQPQHLLKQQEQKPSIQGEQKLIETKSLLQSSVNKIHLNLNANSNFNLNSIQNPVTIPAQQIQTVTVKKRGPRKRPSQEQNRSKPVEKPKGRARDKVIFDDKGRPNFPINLYSMMIHSIGEILPANMNFHNSHWIFPVGYVATRMYAHPRDPKRKCVYTCKILNNAGTPQFQIIPDNDLDSVYFGENAKVCHQALLDSLQHCLGDTFKIPFEVQGEHFFGLSNPIVRTLIQMDPNFKQCNNFIGFLNEIPGLMGSMIVPENKDPAINFDAFQRLLAAATFKNVPTPKDEPPDQLLNLQTDLM